MELEPTVADFDEDSELKAYNDPFEAVGDTAVHRRQTEKDDEIVLPLSAQDEAKLMSLMDDTSLEGALIRDSCSKMIAMNLVRPDILMEMQENFDFEQVRNFSLGLCPSPVHRWTFLQISLRRTNP